MKDPRLCVTKWCRNPKANRRRVCHKCYKRSYAKRHPIRNAYFNLRTNAKRREKQFDLTLEQFRKFAIETSYIDKRGRTARKFHIDRINNSKGYSADNIQSITCRANANKRNYEDYPALAQEEEDLPF